MINRKKGPEIHPVQKLNIPGIDQYTLPNGVKVCEVNLGSQEIVKIEAPYPKDFDVLVKQLEKFNG